MQKGLPAMGAPDASNRNEMFMAPARLLSSHLETYSGGGRENGALLPLPAHFREDDVSAIYSASGEAF